MKVPMNKVIPLAEDLMVDSCHIIKGKDRTGPGDYDAFDLTYEEFPEEVLYEGKCMVTAINSFPSTVVIAGEPQIMNYYWVRIPIGFDASEIIPEDIVIIDNVGPTGDANLIGRQFVIQDYETSTYAAMRNIRVVLYQDVPA